MKNVLVKLIVEKVSNTLKFISVAVSILLASQLQAAPITLNDVAESPLKINETFVQFYSFADPTPWSANTGFEKANTITAFVAQYLDEQALFLIFSGPGGDAGTVNFDITGSEGAISFVDDPIRRLPDGTRVPRDPVVGSNVSMAYVEEYTDGLIYSGLFSDDWSMEITFNSFSNLNEFRFLGFDEQGNDVVLYSSDSIPSSFTLISAAQSVSAPFIGSLAILAIIMLGRRFVASK